MRQIDVVQELETVSRSKTKTSRLEEKKDSSEGEK